MRSIIVGLSLLICSATFAQEKKAETKKETETKTVKVKSEKGTVEQKVKVTTTEKQDIKVSEDPSHHENMDRVSTEKHVTKTVAFENDFDPFYDSGSDSEYFIDGDTEYTFKTNGNGFTMSTKDEAQAMKDVGMARLTSVKRLYLINIDGNNGVGYFNKDGNFMVEFYDNKTSTMMTKEFSGKEQ